MHSAPRRFERRNESNVVVVSWHDFVKLVDNIQLLIDSFVDSLLDKASDIEEILCDQEVKEKVLPTLEKLAHRQDPHLVEAIAKLAQGVRFPNQIIPPAQRLR